MITEDETYNYFRPELHRSCNECGRWMFIGEWVEHTCDDQEAPDGS